MKTGKDEIYGYEKGDLPRMTYSNFTTPERGFRGHPHIILTEDFERIKNKKHLFARKFDMNIDSKVLDMFDYINDNL